MAFTDNYLFKMTPAPSGGNLSQVNWVGYLDTDTNDIVIYDELNAVEICRIGRGNTGILELVGGYDASGNTFPTVGSGAAGAVVKGDTYIITVGGTLGGTVVAIGDQLTALQDAPAQTASHWNIVEHGLGYVPENVANKATTYGTIDNTKYPSTQATERRYERSLFEQLANGASVGAGPTVLYTNSIPASTFTTNGDRITARYSLNLANNANAKVIQMNFNGTLIFDSTGINLASVLGYVQLNVTIIRTGTTTARASVSFIGNAATWQSALEVDLTGITFTGAITMNITGAGVADNDIIAKLAEAKFCPAFA